MKKINLLFLLLLFAFGSQAQEARKKVKEGNKAYQEGAFDQAEINYREALAAAKDLDKNTSQFNLGDALYKQERWGEAKKAFEESLVQTEDPELKSDIYHNLGNVHMQEQNLEEAIKAYKNALKYDPQDEETRVNLAKALSQQKQEQQQQKQQDQNKEDQKDQQDKQDQQDQQNKNDQQEQNQNQDQSQSEDQKNQSEQQDSEQNKNQKEQESKGENQSKEQEAERQKTEMKRKNIERLLEALSRQEEATQEKVQRKKMKSKPSNSTKDW